MNAKNGIKLILLATLFTIGLPISQAGEMDLTIKRPTELDDETIRKGIASRIADYVDSTTQPVDDVLEWITPASQGGKFNPDSGQWIDINYSDSASPAVFPPLDHVQRLQLLTHCYTHSQCNQSTHPELLNVMSTAMQHFARGEYHSKNWWFNHIGIPHEVGELLVYIEARSIPVNAADYQALAEAPYLDIREPADYGGGANAIDIALADMYSGIVRKVPHHLKDYSEIALAEIGQDNMGINADKSFFSHGPMLNTNSYGRVLVTRTLQVEQFTQGYFSMPEKSLKAMDGFMDQGMFPTYRGRYYDYLTGGRGGVSREGSIGAGFNNKALERLFPEKAEHYKLVNLVTSGIAAPDKMPYRDVKGYWNGDYLLKNEQGYQYSVLTHSSRTLPIEQGNGENLLGALISMGAHSIRLSGNEYYNIFPLWDWLKVPGATGREGQSLLPDNRKGMTFSGTMSASGQAMMVYTQDKNGVSVKKAHFVFRDAIIVMASEVTAREPGNVMTSLDQSWFRGEVSVGLKNGDSLILNSGDEYSDSGDNLSYLLHNGIAYIPLDSQNYSVSVEERIGQWTLVNNSQSDRDVTGTVFTAWIDHGSYPTTETYAYAIYPHVTKELVTTLNPRSRFITFNEKDTLIVYDKQNDILQIAMRQPGQWSDSSFTLITDQAGMYIVMGASTKAPTLYFADPTQSFKSVSISFHNTFGGSNAHLMAPDYKVTNVVSQTLNIGSDE